MKKRTICRVCHQLCPLILEEQDGAIVKVHGDKDNPIYHGYSCIKGREIAAYHDLPARLLHPLKRGGDGFTEISSATALDEIAGRLEAIRAEHGPRSIALYCGTAANNKPPSIIFGKALLEAIGSPMYFNSQSIDQPGKFIAGALHGVWQAGDPPLETIDAAIMVGLNPMISVSGFGFNPAWQLKQGRKRGMALIVVDPRKTETAEIADLHLQCKPGEDPTILAGIVRAMIEGGWCDHAFIAEEVSGFQALREAVAPFTPDYVAGRAGIDADDLVKAARIYGSAKRGGVFCGTGTNMAPRGNLTEYLGKSLQTLAGHWLRAGEAVPNSGVLLGRQPYIAAASGPKPAWDLGEKSRMRGLAMGAAGMPTGTILDEILTSGEGQIRALFVVGGNPMGAWPNQNKALKALQKLDLLICIDPRLSGTARLAHYVLPPKLPLETYATSAYAESWGASRLATGLNYDRPYAMATAPILAPPAGSDVMEEWQVMLGIAQRMGRPLKIRSMSIPDPAKANAQATLLGADAAPSPTDVWRMILKDAPVPYDDVLNASETECIFDVPEQIVAPKPAGWAAKLDIGNATMIEELGAVATERSYDQRQTRPYLLISRRLNDVYNSQWREHEKLLSRHGRHNPAYMNPTDLAALKIDDGSLIEIESDLARIAAIARAAPDIRSGCISIAHGWGANPGDIEVPEDVGGAVNRLCDDATHYDRYTGMPRLSAVPVTVYSAEN